MGRTVGLGRIWSFVLGFRSLVARLVPFERGGTKPGGEKLFGNGKCELIANFSATMVPLREGRDGKCEGRNEKCEVLARESVSSSPVVRSFGKGKCKFIANFSTTMVTSLPSLSVCISLSLSHRKYPTHNIGSASALPIIGLGRIHGSQDSRAPFWTGTVARTGYPGIGPFDHLSWVFDHLSRGSRHSRESRNKEGEFFGNGKCEFQHHNGETGSVKGETKSAIFWLGKVGTHSNSANFGMGKCKLIANFSATMMTSLPSISLSLSLSLCISLSLSLTHRAYLTHDIGSASALPITNILKAPLFYVLAIL